MTDEPCARLGKAIGPNKSIVLCDIIGTGSFSVVYGGESKDGVLYAVKTISKNRLSKTQLTSQRREASFLNALQHENIARLYDVIEDSHYMYLLMERAQTDLYEAITNRGGFSLDVSKNIFDQICNGLLYSHENGIFHRDIKPENILISASKVKLADFGLATRETFSTELGCGSVRYMAPECLGINNSRGYLPAANDVWSLGIILINLLFGKNPWHEASATDPIFGPYISRHPEILRDQFNLSQEFDLLLRRVFAIDVRKRISLKELRQAVAQCSAFTCKDIEDTCEEQEYSITFESDDEITCSGVTSTSSKTSQPRLIDHSSDDMDEDYENNSQNEDNSPVSCNSSMAVISSMDYHTPSNGSLAGSNDSMDDKSPVNYSTPRDDNSPVLLDSKSHIPTTAAAPPPSPNCNEKDLSIQQLVPWEIDRHSAEGMDDCDNDFKFSIPPSWSSSSLALISTTPNDYPASSWADDFAEMDFSNPPLTVNSNSQHHNISTVAATEVIVLNTDYENKLNSNEDNKAKDMSDEGNASEIFTDNDEHEFPHQRKTSNAFSVATHDSGFLDEFESAPMLDEFEVSEEPDAKPLSFTELLVSSFLRALGEMGIGHSSNSSASSTL